MCDSGIGDSKELEAFDYWAIKKPAAIRKQENRALLTFGVKKCKKCGKVKELAKFPHCKSTVDHLQGNCRECSSKWQKEHRQIPEVKIRNKTYNKSPGRKAQMKVQNQKPEIKVWMEEYYQRPEVKARRKARMKGYLQKPEVKTRNNERQKERLTTDLNFKITCNLRGRMNHALKDGYKSGSAVEDLGCSIDEFRIYLEGHFNPGMTWDNYGKGPGKWNLDHIVPLSAFDLTNREQFLSAAHYSNYQPLWSEENLSKGNRY